MKRVIVHRDAEAENAIITGVYRIECKRPMVERNTCIKNSVGSLPCPSRYITGESTFFCR